MALSIRSPVQMMRIGLTVSPTLSTGTTVAREADTVPRGAAMRPVRGLPPHPVARVSAQGFVQGSRKRRFVILAEGPDQDQCIFCVRRHSRVDDGTPATPVDQHPRPVCR